MTAANSAPVSVSVIVRSMDRPELRDALDSLARQDHPALEIIVVDATGGRHGPLPTLDLSPGHSLRFVSTGQRLPRPQAADLGLMSASGEWLNFIDDDDTCEPTHVSSLVAAAQAAPDAPLVYGRGRRLDAQGNLEEIFGRPFNRAIMHVTPLLYWQAALIRTRVRDLGCRFDPAFEVCEDRDFLAQVAQLGDFAYAPHVATFNFRPDLGTSGTGSGPNRDCARLARFDSQLRAKWTGVGTWHLERVAVQCRRGIRLFQAGRPDLAGEAFAAVLAQYRDDPNALHGLARVALARGDLQEAQRYARDALTVNPQSSVFRATLAAAGGHEEVQERPAQPTAARGSCPCGSGHAFRACCGRSAADPGAAPDDVDALCVQARAALDAGDLSTAWETLQSAAALRCAPAVVRLLGECCARLAAPQAQASLWSMVRDVCAASAAFDAPPAASTVVVGAAAHVQAALRALEQEAGEGGHGACDVVESLDHRAQPWGGSTRVVFADPRGVPLHGVEGGGPGRVLLLSPGGDAEPVVRALARLAQGWPRTRLDYRTVSL